MFKIITSLSMFLVGQLAQSQDQVQPFNKIHAVGNVQVILKKSPVNAIQFIEGSGQASAEVAKGVLTIQSAPGGAAILEVSAIEISEIVANGASVRIQSGLSTEKLAVKLTRGATIHGNIETKKASVSAHDGSVVSARLNTDSFNGKFGGKSKACLSGKSNLTTLDTRGQSLCLARNLISARTSVNAFGKSDVTVNTLGKLNADADESAKITCIGSHGKAMAGSPSTVAVHALIY